MSSPPTLFVTPPSVAEDPPRYMSGVSARRAEQAVEALNAAGSAPQAEGAERRREPRQPHAGQVSVKVALRTAYVAGAGASRSVFVEVYARNLSQSGFGFVAPPIYLPEDEGQPALALRGEEVFAAGKIVQVAIIRREGTLRWMKARVVRARVVDDGFVECGVEFV